MSTNALHLELVSKLTTESFIASFRRFAARRGKPHTVYSDNGFNFVGAHNELKNLNDFLQNEQVQTVLQNTFYKEHIAWNFISARSPTFGGLWEAGVKTVKFHLKRVLNNAKVTFEDMYTILVQIEAIANSRPLSPLSSDPNDLNSLTPAHFLISKPFTQIPDNNYVDVPQNRLKLHHQLQQIQ